MKTSPKTSVALLAILALGGSTAGSLFSESLESNVSNTIGTAGAFFSAVAIQGSTQQVTSPANGTGSEGETDVVALPIEARTTNPTSVAEMQVRAITNLEVTQTPIAQSTLVPEPSATPEPSAAPEPSALPEPSGSPEPNIEPSPTPEASPEVSASSTPEPDSLQSPESE